MLAHARLRYNTLSTADAEEAAVLIGYTRYGKLAARGESGAMSRYTPDTIISDVLRSDPSKAAVFEAFGLGCAGCLAAGMETISAVATMHEVPVAELVNALNATDALEEA